MLSNSSVIARAKNQVSCDVAGEAVILSLKSGMYYGLEGVGARIWNLIREPRVFVDIRDTILQEFAVEPEACEQDAQTFLEAMVAEGLIEVTNETSS